MDPEEIPLKQIRTFQGDIAETLQKGQKSLVSIQRAEHLKKGPPDNTSSENFKNKKEILPLVEPMFKLLDQTYSSLSTYTPITDEQIKTYKEKYFPFIDKNYVICVEDENHELVAFAITMPSYSRALQKAKGKLFPFGWWHFLQAGKKNDRANFYLIGIQPEYQRRGVTSIIFKEIFVRFNKMGIKFAETNPELEENKSVQVLWQDYHPTNHKRRRTYSLEITD